MGWAAAFGRLGVPALLLYAGSIAWVIGYDTIYAHQDRDDDALIGIKSTALLFGPRTKPMLALFYGLAVILIGAAGMTAGAGLVFALGLVGFAAHLAWQIVRLDIADPDRCLALFRSDRDAGLILFAGLLLDAALKVAALSRTVGTAIAPRHGEAAIWRLARHADKVAGRNIDNGNRNSGSESGPSFRTTGDADPPDRVFPNSQLPNPHWTSSLESSIENPRTSTTRRLSPPSKA